MEETDYREHMETNVVSLFVVLLLALAIGYSWYSFTKPIPPPAIATAPGPPPYEVYGGGWGPAPYTWTIPSTIYGPRSYDLVITTTSPLPSGTQGVPYTSQLVAVGGKRGK